MDIKCYNYFGTKPGKTLLIFGAIHGDERSGPYAIEFAKKMFDEGALTLKKGKLVMVPVCNQKAYDANKIFIDENLNRIFKKHPNPVTYEQRIANELTKFVDEADYLLDIHNYHHQGDNMVFQDYPGRARDALALAQPVKYRFTHWNDAYEGFLDSTSPTERYAFSVGVAGITTEAGNYLDPAANSVACEAIIRTLLHLDLIEQSPEIKPIAPPQSVRMKKTYFKDREGDFARLFASVEQLAAGTLIASYSDGEQIIMPYDGYIILPKSNAKIGREWFYLGI